LTRQRPYEIIDVNESARVALCPEIFQEDACLLDELFETCGGGFAQRDYHPLIQGTGDGTRVVRLT
jgi:hypothetical protein